RRWGCRCGPPSATGPTPAPGCTASCSPKPAMRSRRTLPDPAAFSWRGWPASVALGCGQHKLSGGGGVNPPRDNAKDIFLEAVDMPSAAQRRAYLDAACAGDAVLRREVEELLRHHGRMGSFLQAVGSEQLATRNLPGVGERPGTVLGPYKLLQQ